MYQCLFEPMKIGNLTINNRFVMPAMNSNLADADHHLREQAVRYYSERAKGGYGLLFTEFICVSEEGLAHPKQAAIYDDEFIDDLKKITDGVHENGGKIFCQLHHAGRIAISGNPNLPIVAPSVTPVAPDGVKLHELTLDDIKVLIDRFTQAAVRAKKAGFDGVEVHGAHGYLLDLFLDKATNKRTDMYGGSITNRARIVCDIVKSIKAACGADYPVCVRINGQSTKIAGNHIEEGAAQALLIEQSGADVINVSYGIPIETYYKDAGFNLDNVKRVKEMVNVPVIGVGRINDPTLALMAVKGGYMDFVATGRQSIADPHFPEKIKEGRINEIISCTGCLQRCLYKLDFEPGYGISCMNNPFSGKEGNWVIEETKQPKKIAVVGGGPAGTQAAWVLAKRGHKVHLFEKEATFGGQFKLAALPSMKSDLSKTITTYVELGKKYGVEYHLATVADKALLTAEGFEVVIDATGSVPLVPSIEGIDNENVCNALDVLRYEKQFMKKNLVVLGAGLVGAETAELLLEQGNKVTLVDMVSMIAPTAPMLIRMRLTDRLNKSGVVFKSECRVNKITQDGVVVLHGEQEETLAGFDGVVLAFGSRSNEAFKKEMEGSGMEFYQIGDSSKAGDARKGIFEATELALKL